jgi:hypothetical protein
MAKNLQGLGSQINGKEQILVHKKILTLEQKKKIVFNKCNLLQTERHAKVSLHSS